MAAVAAGEIDRRIRVERLQVTRDRANDEVRTWALDFKLWAMRRTATGLSGGMREKVAEQMVLREADVAWTVRVNARSRTIAPETHRIVYGGKVHEIVGILEGVERDDSFHILTATRPDQRGSALPGG